MTENSRGMKVACNNIFMSIFIAKVATDSRGMFLLVWSMKLVVFNLKKGKLLDENPDNPNPIRTYCWKCCLTFYILDTCFCTTILDWNIFGLRTLDTILNLSYFVFILHLWSQYPHHLEAIQSICYANWLIGLWMIWTLWLKCIVLTLYMFYLFFLSIYLLHVIFGFPIDVIYFMVCYCWCCCCSFVF